MKSQVTTGTGDAGETRTLGGERLSKSSPVVECTGCLDEVRAYTALVRLHLLESGAAQREEAAAFLLWVLHLYFLIGTACNDPRNRRPELRKGEAGEAHLRRVEAFQAKLEQRVKLPSQFIVSASTGLSAELDVLATQVRRLERALVRLKEAVPEFNVRAILPLVNRLSDTFYVLARSFEEGHYQTVDYTLLEDGNTEDGG